MYINRLPQECLERLSCSLKYGPSVNWEALALEGFPSIYSNRLKLAKIGSSPHPASGLLDDLCCRGVSVETLLEALKVIGNARAVFVILEGELFSYSCFFLFPLAFSKHLPENNLRKPYKKSEDKGGLQRLNLSFTERELYLIFSPRHLNACNPYASLKATSNFSF